MRTMMTSIAESLSRGGQRAAARYAGALRLEGRRGRSSIGSTRSLSCLDRPEYAEEIQARQIKDEAFYEEHAKRQQYFYHIDLQGRLFIEDVTPKNVATCLKSAKFLDFFWRRLRPNDRGEHEEYPFVSPCGKEMNFIRPADTPIVFGELERGPDGEERLAYAATMHEHFDPALLAWDTDTDRLYYPVRKHPRLAGSLGLVKSHLSVQLSQHFAVQGDDQILFEWAGAQHPIRTAAAARRELDNATTKRQ